MANRMDLITAQEDLTLKVWDGDDSAKAEILVAWGPRLEKAIGKAFPKLSAQDVEDVVAEAIWRFWVWRSRYDPGKAGIHTMLYRIARRVAIERRTGHLKAQKAQIREKLADAEFFATIASPEPEPPDDPPDEAKSGKSPIQKALTDCFEALPELQKDILTRYGEAGTYELNAAEVGKELGEVHKGGVPIPAGTIRTYKTRAWDSLENCMRNKNFDLKALGYTND